MRLGRLYGTLQNKAPSIAFSSRDSAAGVKIREGKRVAAARHAVRAAALFRQLALLPSRRPFEAALGMIASGF